MKLMVMTELDNNQYAKTMYVTPGISDEELLFSFKTRLLEIKRDILLAKILEENPQYSSFNELPLELMKPLYGVSWDE